MQFLVNLTLGNVCPSFRAVRGLNIHAGTFRPLFRMGPALGSGLSHPSVCPPRRIGAGSETRTRNNQVGSLELYHLSYTCEEVDPDGIEPSSKVQTESPVTSPSVNSTASVAVLSSAVNAGCLRPLVSCHLPTRSCAPGFHAPGLGDLPDARPVVLMRPGLRSGYRGQAAATISQALLLLATIVCPV